MCVLDPTALLARGRAARSAGSDRATIAAGIHEAVADGATRLGVELAAAHGLDTVALTGGVFQNVAADRPRRDRAHAQGLEVLVHERVPPNDGGISIGQAAIAALDRGLSGQERVRSQAYQSSRPSPLVAETGRTVRSGRS